MPRDTSHDPPLGPRRASGSGLLGQIPFVGGLLGGSLSGNDERAGMAAVGAGQVGDYFRTGLDEADFAREGGLRRIGGGYNQARDALGQGYTQGREAATGLFGQSQDLYNGAANEMRGAYGQGQGALAGGAAQAQGILNPYINQDLAARGAYQQRLMGGLAGGDDPYWNRLAGQRNDSIEASLAKQGMLGSSAGGQALADSGAQLQNMREQQFFDRAQGLFNSGAASQAAGLAQGYGQASAGLYGQQATGLGGIGQAAAGARQEQGQYLGNFGARQGEGTAGLFAGEANQAANAWEGYGNRATGLAGHGMGATAGLWGTAASGQKGLLDQVNLGYRVGG